MAHAPTEMPHWQCVPSIADIIIDVPVIDTVMQTDKGPAVINLVLLYLFFKEKDWISVVFSPHGYPFYLTYVVHQ